MACAQADLLADARAAFQREALERRRLHNLVQELQGNIRVFVRVKPLMPEELAGGQASVLRCESDRRIHCMVQGSAKVLPEASHRLPAQSRTTRSWHTISFLNYACSACETSHLLRDLGLLSSNKTR